MSGRILVVDPDAERRSDVGRILAAAYFSVIEAEDAAAAAPPFDLVICAGAAPRRDLKPVLALTAPGGPAPAALLAEGVEDCLPWPVDPAILLARARNLIRTRILSDELALRQTTARDLGLEPGEQGEPPRAPRLLVIGAEGGAIARTLKAFPEAELSFAETGFAAMSLAERIRPDLVIVAERPRPAGATGFAEAEGAAGVISALRSRPAARNAAIVHLSRPALDGSSKAAIREVVSAFEAGASDSVAIDADPAELIARLAARLRAKRGDDALRAWLDGGLRLAAVDTMTGLHNRRYFDLHAERLYDRARASGAPLSALVFDIDRFKTINDRHGHGAGDAALRAFAARLREGVRGADLVARIGGEEFAVILRNASAADAAAAAERVRAAIAAAPVALTGEETAAITVSAGVSSLRPEDDSAAGMMARADAALSAAKQGGRNRVRVAAGLSAAVSPSS